MGCGNKGGGKGRLTGQAGRRPHHPSSCIIKLLRPLMNSAWNEPTKLSILINYYPKCARELGEEGEGEAGWEAEGERSLNLRLQLLLRNLHLMTTMRKQNTYQIICNKFHTNTDTHCTHTHTFASLWTASAFLSSCQLPRRGSLFGQGCIATQ